MGTRTPASRRPTPTTPPNNESNNNNIAVADSNFVARSAPVEPGEGLEFEGLFAGTYHCEGNDAIDFTQEGTHFGDLRLIHVAPTETRSSGDDIDDPTTLADALKRAADEDVAIILQPGDYTLANPVELTRGDGAFVMAGTCPNEVNISASTRDKILNSFDETLPPTEVCMSW